MTNNNLTLNVVMQQQNLESINKEIDESTDRAVGILCGSILEEQLSKIIKVFLIDDRKVEKNFLGGQGPISTFDTKILACYCMGLIDRNEYENLQIIRKIRNKFAHSFEPIDFNNQSISDLCSNFKISIDKYMPKNVQIKDYKVQKLDLEPLKKHCSVREKFLIVFNYLSMIFIFREFEASKTRLNILDDKETISVKENKIMNELEEEMIKNIELLDENIKLLDENIKLLQKNRDKLEEHPELIEVNKDIESKKKEFENLLEENKQREAKIIVRRAVCEAWDIEYKRINTTK